MQHRSLILITLLVVLDFASAVTMHAQWVTQQIELKPGWNAVFLEVDPSPADPGTLLAGLPVESVWDWNRAADPAQFVQDPSTLIPGAPGWMTWFPAGSPLASESTLFALRDGRPYLIRTTNSQPVTWTVTGRPSLRRLSWQSGMVNWVGFHVATPAPSFQALFAGQTGLAGQPVYALDATGAWRAFADLSAARPRPGESYWVRCRLPAQAAGTILVDAGSRRGLEFGAAGAEQSVRIRNATATARQITVRLLTSATPPAGEPLLAGPVPLEYWRSSYATTNFGWEPLTGPLTLTGLPAGQDWNLRLGVRRNAAAAAASGSQFQSVLEVTDDLGTRWVIPVTADPVSAAGALAGLQDASQPGTPLLSGLWIGDAVLNAVSMPAHPADGSATRPASGTFSFRLILHVDAAGTTRLLQQVFLVRKPPVLEADIDDPFLSHVVEPARTVAVSDEALIPGIVGAETVVGRRVSSPAFAFGQPLILAGGAFGAGTLQGAVALDYDHPLNPFKHTFHPDHNNQDERFEQKLPEGRESFTVNRSLALEFSATDPLGLNPPGWGSTEVGGTYRETITGLHRAPIRVGGTFRLVRVLPTAVLNQ